MDMDKESIYTYNQTIQCILPDTVRVSSIPSKQCPAHLQFYTHCHTGSIGKKESKQWTCVSFDPPSVQNWTISVLWKWRCKITCCKSITCETVFGQNQ